MQDSDPANGNTVAAIARYLPIDSSQLEAPLHLCRPVRQGDGTKVYDYTILRNSSPTGEPVPLFPGSARVQRLTGQKLLSDLLVSFTYIPGTVIQLGYGSLYEKCRWEETGYRPDDRFLEMKRGLFFKASYLWRL